MCLDNVTLPAWPGTRNRLGLRHHGLILVHLVRCLFLLSPFCCGGLFRYKKACKRPYIHYSGHWMEGVGPESLDFLKAKWNSRAALNLPYSYVKKKAQRPSLLLTHSLWPLSSVSSGWRCSSQTPSSGSGAWTGQSTVRILLSISPRSRSS
jgi:hypothetical protein